MKQRIRFHQTEKKEGQIKNIFLQMRCVKKTLNYDGDEFKVFVIKDTPARGISSKIVVDNKFFEEFNKWEQRAILYHEKHHQKFFTLIKRVFNIIKFFSLKRARWQEEFDADNYAKIKVSKKVVLSFLEKSKKLYETDKIAYNKKTHPPIEERIKNVQSG